MTDRWARADAQTNTGTLLADSQCRRICVQPWRHQPTPCQKAIGRLREAGAERHILVCATNRTADRARPERHLCSVTRKVLDEGAVAV